MPIEQKETHCIDCVSMIASDRIEHSSGAYLRRIVHPISLILMQIRGYRLPDAISNTQSNVYGATLTGGFQGGVLSLEGAYYDSREDREGTVPGIENGQAKGLAGYTYPLWEDATVGVQGFVEWMIDYDAYRASLPALSPVREERRWTATTRFTQFLLHQTLSLNFFAFWGVTEHDAYIIPSVRYSVTDGLGAEIGANLFGGEESHTMFGALDRNDNVYLSLRHGF